MTDNRFAFLVCWTVVFGFITNEARAETKPRTQPNILFILTDDQGWPSLGCYGSEHAPTPNNDRLAEQGLRFTDAYVMPQCTPTRAALLTGQHTARNGMWHVIRWYGSPWARVSEPAFVEQLLPEKCRLPQRLRAAGYRTGIAGKWHVTTNQTGSYMQLNKQAADDFGFDYVAPLGEGSQNEGDKWVDHLTDCASSFIEKNQKQPWFFYLSHHTLHGVVSAPESSIEKYAQAGAPATGLQNATYLVAIEHLDQSVGRLMRKLDLLKLRDDTVVVFLSDNGGVDTSYALPAWSDQPLNGSEPLKPRNQEFDNAPLREGKGSLYEGGIRVPCIVRWPTNITPASVSQTPIHVVDWMPTLLSIAGVADVGDTDGVNLMPVFRGETIHKRPLYWYAPLYDLRWASTPAAAIRQGDWKLIEHFGDRFDANQQYQIGQHSELYNLRDDIGETNDCSVKHVERATAMRQRLRQWIDSIPAPIPMRNPHYDAERAFEETREKQPWNR